MSSKSCEYCVEGWVRLYKWEIFNRGLDNRSNYFTDILLQGTIQYILN